jgi:general secretion pathway protein B
VSFILDALKKSENARQRQIGPSLADISPRRARSDRPWWAVAVAGLLVVNLGVLIVVLTRDDTSETPQSALPQKRLEQTAQQSPAAQPAQQPMQAQIAPPVGAMPAPARMNPAVRSLADEAGEEGTVLQGDATIDPALAGAANVPEGPPVVRAITPPNVAPLSNQPTFAARARAGTSDEEMLPTNSSLIASGTNLPEMKLDIHVYSANPAERFVFVNMRKYVEGQSLSEGPVIERITTDGAILNQHGTRFLLPRQ